MKKIQYVLLFIAQLAVAQQGGMWIPSLLKGMNETEMKNLGMKISVEDLYSVNHSSLKDAVPHFNGGCTSEVISPKGLLLTNHHCGFDAIQNHSSTEHDYLTNGFWAYKMEDELPNENLVVTFIVKIEDVTKQVLEGVDDQATEAAKQQKIEANMATVASQFPKETWQENKIKTFYEGNQYLLFVTETFKDVRLVGTPPSSIGKFGSDTDNWVWPRHTGDFSIFRIYADANNHPAVYAKTNVPYVPKHFLPISLDGVDQDDFTMVMGYPGRTTEYLPAVAVAQIQNDLNPAKIEVREAALKIADSYMRKDNAIKIQYASKYASIANYWKKWIGETQGLKKSNAVLIKQKQEKAFLEKVAKANKQAIYGQLLNEFEQNYAAIKEYALARDYFSEVMIRNVEFTGLAYKVYQLEQVYQSKGKDAFEAAKKNMMASMPDFYKDFNKNVDQKIFEKLIDIYQNKVPKPFLPDHLKNAVIQNVSNDLYNKSVFINLEGLQTLLNNDNNTITTILQNDPAYNFIKQVVEKFQKEVVPTYNELNLKNNALLKTYMKAQLELNPNARIFPDANSTLRVTYGKVKGYEPKDATVYKPITYLEGVIEKYVPGDYEFDVPHKLIDLYQSKDYGVYAENGKMPVCFIATNHTTGGNSGSPAIDAYGNLIGLNFDRVWEGTMSDIYYDAQICRNVMVDARYILFIIDKFAGAQNLISELKLVHPKKKPIKKPSKKQ